MSKMVFVDGGCGDADGVTFALKAVMAERQKPANHDSIAPKGEPDPRQIVVPLELMRKVYSMSLPCGG